MLSTQWWAMLTNSERTGPLRVLVLEPEGRGGDWQYTVAFSGGLSEEGVDAALGTVSPWEPVPYCKPVPILSIARRLGAGSGAGRLSPRRFAFHLHKLLGVRKAIEQHRPDIVHFQGPLGKLDFLHFRYIKFLGPRIVFTAHDARPLPPGRRVFDRARYNQADKVLVHSTSALRGLVSSGISEDKLTKIREGNFLHQLRQSNLSASQAKELLGVPADARLLLFFGWIQPRKGLDLLIEAFALLRRDHADLYLVIAGLPGEDFRPYQNLINSLGIADRVVLALRWIPSDEVPNYFGPADVVVLPYRRIHFSAVLQLAYAHGKPLIVTNVGGIDETVSEDHTGIVAVSPDAQGIAAAIRQFLSDPVAAAQMGERGRRLAETKYSWRMVAREVMEIYRQVLSRPYHHVTT